MAHWDLGRFYYISVVLRAILLYLSGTEAIVLQLSGNQAIPLWLTGT